MKHYLKTLTEYFNAVESGNKTFEVRYDDRGFKVGDTLILQEWNGWERTGRELVKKVTYVLEDPQFCKGGIGRCRRRQPTRAKSKHIGATAQAILRR